MCARWRGGGFMSHRDKCERATLTGSITEAWWEGTSHVRTRERRFHHPGARSAKNKSLQRHNTLFQFTDRWGSGGMWVIHVLSRTEKERNQIYVSLTGNSPAEMAAAEQCHPCHHNPSFFSPPPANTSTWCAWLSRGAPIHTHMSIFHDTAGPAADNDIDLNTEICQLLCEQADVEILHIHGSSSKRRFYFWLILFF